MKKIAILILLFWVSVANAEKYTVDFVDVEVNTFIKFVSEVSGKKFVTSADVKGNVTVIAAEPIEKNDILALFDSVMSSNGFIVLPGDGFDQVVTVAGARKYAPMNGLSISKNQLVTQIFKIKTAGVEDIKSLLGGIVPDGAVSADEKSRVLIVTDTKINMDKVAAIIKSADADLDKKVLRVYELKFADATETSDNLKNCVDEKIKISADKSNNSLYVYADADSQSLFADTIKTSDIERPMVYLEALIVEVDEGTSFDLGMDLSNLQPVLTIGENVFSIADMTSVLSALEGKSHVRIVSRPKLMATDNQEAIIKVGKKVPFQTTVTASTTGSTAYNSYDYRDIGLTLKINPRITGDLIKMTIYQELSALSPDSTATMPTALTRSVDTKLTVRDGHLLMVGGLIDEQTEAQVKGIPGLKSIPYLGRLFRAESLGTTRTDLYIIISPKIILGAAKADGVTQTQVGSSPMLKKEMEQ